MRQPLLKTALAATWTALVLHAAPAHAGRSCEAAKPTPQMFERGLNLAERTLHALDTENTRSGAKVVMLARMGQDLSKYGLRYSHFGYAYKLPSGQWLVAHKLNTCNTAEAAVYRQGLGEFFLDDVWRFEAAWVVPTPEVQDRLHAVLVNDATISTLHTKPYSMVSYAWAQKYQQSNQWALETLAFAMEPSANNRTRAQAWLQFKAYEPGTLKIGALTRLGGRVTAANIAFDDHPNEKRFSDRIETVTVDSVFSWLQKSGLGGAPAALR
ncbi:MAG: DUF2145 domain-containing protein [Pseudomonadota bacterium]